MRRPVGHLDAELDPGRRPDPDHQSRLVVEVAVRALDGERGGELRLGGGEQRVPVIPLEAVERPLPEVGARSRHGAQHPFGVLRPGRRRVEPVHAAPGAGRLGGSVRGHGASPLWASAPMKELERFQTSADRAAPPAPESADARPRRSPCPRRADVSRALGVSVTPMSNAFSRPDQLPPRPRAVVPERAEAMGCRGPGAEGRLLRSGYAGAVAPYDPEPVPDLPAAPLARAFLAGLAEVAQAHQAGVVLLPAVPQDGHDRPRPGDAPLLEGAAIRPTRARWLGYADAFDQAGIARATAPIGIAGVTERGRGRGIAEALPSARPRPTALARRTDVPAPGALHAGATGGLAVPGAVAICGFEDLPGGAEERAHLRDIGGARVPDLHRIPPSRPAPGRLRMPQRGGKARIPGAPADGRARRTPTPDGRLPASPNATKTARPGRKGMPRSRKPRLPGRDAPSPRGRSDPGPGGRPACPRARRARPGSS
jgi:hypothetical protein